MVYALARACSLLQSLVEVCSPLQGASAPVGPTNGDCLNFPCHRLQQWPPPAGTMGKSLRLLRPLEGWGQVIMIELKLNLVVTHCCSPDGRYRFSGEEVCWVQSRE